MFTTWWCSYRFWPQGVPESTKWKFYSAALITPLILWLSCNCDTVTLLLACHRSSGFFINILCNVIATFGHSGHCPVTVLSSCFRTTVILLEAPGSCFLSSQIHILHICLQFIKNIFSWFSVTKPCWPILNTNCMSVLEEGSLLCLSSSEFCLFWLTQCIFPDKIMLILITINWVTYEYYLLAILYYYSYIDNTLFHHSGNQNLEAVD